MFDDFQESAAMGCVLGKKEDRLLELDTNLHVKNATHSEICAYLIELSAAVDGVRSTVWKLLDAGGKDHNALLNAILSKNDHIANLPSMLAQCDAAAREAKKRKDFAEADALDKDWILLQGSRKSIDATIFLVLETVAGSACAQSIKTLQLQLKKRGINIETTL